MKVNKLNLLPFLSGLGSLTLMVYLSVIFRVSKLR